MLAESIIILAVIVDALHVITMAPDVPAKAKCIGCACRRVVRRQSVAVAMYREETRVDVDIAAVAKQLSDVSAQLAALTQQQRSR